MMAWRSVPGYEGYYLISNNGAIKCVHRYRRTEYLTPWKRKLGTYWLVTLWKKSKRKHRSIHSLILEAFRGPRKKGVVCRHMDGVRTNNNIYNLKYGTVRENHFDKKLHGTFQEGENHGMAKLTETAVRDIRTSSSTLKVMAEKHGVTQATASMVRRKLSWAHVK